jgi:hypothetical protein
VLASSYAGVLTITVRVDPAAFGDLDVLMTAMQRDWSMLAGVATPERVIADQRLAGVDRERVNAQ